MAVAVKTGPSFQAGTPTALFEIPGAVDEGYAYDSRVYAAAADGRRFLIGVPVGKPVSPPIAVVLNRTAGLKK